MAVNLLADFADPGGVGRHARNFAAALARRVDLVPVHYSLPRGPAPDDAEMPPPRRWDPTGTGICLSTTLGLRLPPGGRRIFYTVTETSRLPAELVEPLCQADEIWVPSECCVASLSASGVDAARTRVVPEGVDCTRFQPAEKPSGGDRFRFLCVGKWEERKGLPLLVRTFQRAFGANEPVELVLHATNPYRSQLDIGAELAKALRGLDAPPIRLSGRLGFDDLVALMQSSDAFVLPTRGEGWGLPILEAMACGLPCIVTGHGGHLTFANPENCLLIDVARMVRVHDPEVYHHGLDWGLWAEPDAAHLAVHMRWVYEDRGRAREIGRAARVAAEQWSWHRAAEIATGYLG